MLLLEISREKPTALKFGAEFDPTQPRAASLLEFVDTFTREVNRPGGVLEAPAAIASFDDFPLNSMLLGLEHSCSDKLEAQDPAPGLEHVRKIKDSISAHASEPINMVTLTEISGRSGATIKRAFRRCRGYTPMQFLQSERIRLVRQRLLFGSPTESVSRIAMECGFFHLGRFAAEYRRHFNENPSETMKRAQNGKQSS